MIDWSKFNLEQASEIVSVANTAHFLYSRLRADPVVQSLAQAPVEALVSAIRGFATEPKRSFIDLVRAYAAIAALTIAVPGSTKQRLLAVDLKSLRWASAIAEIADARHVNTLVTQLTSVIVQSSFSPTTLGASTSIQSFGDWPKSNGSGR